MVWSSHARAGATDGQRTPRLKSGRGTGVASAIASIARRPIGLPGVDEVEVAALDRGLGLELGVGARGVGHELAAVGDHLERPAGPVELVDEIRPAIPARWPGRSGAAASSP